EGIVALKSSILRDPRHHDVRTIADSPYDHRRFVTWSLAYAGPSQFVASKVENAFTRALNDKEDSIETLVEMMAGFATEGNA
ncbi:MAG TPA: BLUF domain-containing protein, partial [Sphingobium sp.]|nr:BLUF domain-containing protein [Sphingobium sp.]